MREASIHITESNLVKVLLELQRNDEFWTNREGYPKMAAAMVRRAKKYSLYSRNINVTDKNSKKRLDKVTSSELEYTNAFLKSFYTIRRLNHRGGNIKYDESHKDWPTVKELSNHLRDFVNSFDLELTKGANDFVKLLFEISPKAIINFWPSIIPSLFEMYGALKDIGKDQYPGETEKLHKLYRQNLIDKVGLSIDYSKNPIMYLSFVKATKMCKEELNCDLDTFIKSQFAGLAWAGGYPQPSQLITPKARERVIKYAFENNLTLKKAEPKIKIDWTKIKNNK